MSHLYPRPRPSGSRPIAQLAIDSPTKKMTALMEETAGGGGIEQKRLTSWSVGACAPKQEKMRSLSHFSRCCNVVGVRERENKRRCVGLCRGGCCGLLMTRGILPSVLSERNQRKRTCIQRWSLDEMFCFHPKLLCTSYTLALVSWFPSWG